MTMTLQNRFCHSIHLRDKIKKLRKYKYRGKQNRIKTVNTFYVKIASQNCTINNQSLEVKIHMVGFTIKVIQPN